MKKVIVIGMSAASVSFVVKLRSLDKNCEILCFSAEKDVPYNRCFLADFLTQDVSAGDLLLKPETFFEQNNIEIQLNTLVTKIETESKAVFVGSTCYPYDYLFLGVGTKPYQLPFTKKELGQSLENVFNFHTLDDMKSISNYIKTNNVKSACVIGGGLNGIEAVSSLGHLSVSVSLIEGQKSVLSGQVDLQIAQWVTSKIRLSGVLVLAGRRAAHFVRQAFATKVSHVQLDTGSMISTDMVIIAAGSAVNLDLVKGTDIETVEGSISVDKFMKTSVENIFAGGDVCRVQCMMTGQLCRSTTWADAMLQGLCAATNVAAAIHGTATRAYPGMVGLRDSYFFGKDFYACGKTIFDSAENVEIITNINDHNVKKIYLQDDELKGFVLIGDISDLSEYKRWYSTRQKVQKSDFLKAVFS
jgi:nitrite reductase (NADH) large subunit